MHIGKESNLTPGCCMRLYQPHLDIIDEDGKRVFKKKLSNNSEVMLNTLALYKDYIAGIVVESMYNWYWLVDILTERGLQGASCKHHEDPEILWTQVCGRSTRCLLAGRDAQAWYSAGGIDLSEGRSSNSRFTQETKLYSTASDIADLKSLEH